MMGDTQDSEGYKEIKQLTLNGTRLRCIFKPCNGELYFTSLSRDLRFINFRCDTCSKGSSMFYSDYKEWRGKFK